jgi:uncharacterized membrane protein YkoI
MTDAGRHRPRPLRGLAAALALASLLPLAGPALADEGHPAVVLPDEDHETARALKEAGTIVSLTRVIEAARARHAGHLLQVELERKGEVYVYEVEFVDADGVVWKMDFDARDASLIESGPEGH